MYAAKNWDQSQQALIVHNPAAEIPFFPDYHYARMQFNAYLRRRATGTAATYVPALEKFLEFIRKDAGNYQTPTLPIVNNYIDDRLASGLSVATVSKNLAPVRRFLSFLASQIVHPDSDDRQYRYLNELRESVRAAAAINNPSAPSESHLSPILRHGVWLRADQINEILHLCDRTTIQGKRDYALLLTGFYTGLRRAELQKLTLAHFDTSSPRTDKIVGLVGKRGNTDDIPCPKRVYEAITDYTNTYNQMAHIQPPLPVHGPGVGLITPNESVWRALTRSGNLYKDSRILGIEGVARIVERRYTTWKQSINPEYDRAADPKPFTCHDMRRSCVLNNYLAGMPPDQIIRITRHKSLDMFMKYVGKLIDYDEINSAERGYILG